MDSPHILGEELISPLGFDNLSATNGMNHRLIAIQIVSLVIQEALVFAMSIHGSQVTVTKLTIQVHDDSDDMVMTVWFGERPDLALESHGYVSDHCSIFQ
jgi:hypothetical protein